MMFLSMALVHILDNFTIHRAAIRRVAPRSAPLSEGPCVALGITFFPARDCVEPVIEVDSDY
jgi:hypothetical protein